MRCRHDAKLHLWVTAGRHAHHRQHTSPTCNSAGQGGALPGRRPAGAPTRPRTASRVPDRVRHQPTARPSRRQQMHATATSDLQICSPARPHRQPPDLPDTPPAASHNAFRSFPLLLLASSAAAPAAISPASRARASHHSWSRGPGPSAHQHNLRLPMQPCRPSQQRRQQQRLLRLLPKSCSRALGRRLRAQAAQQSAAH